MSIRGSGRFLLLSFRARMKLACGIGAAGALLMVGGLAQSGTGFKLMERTGLGQLLHERAWERALAGHSEMEPWPWEDPSLIANTKVPQLGLSAAVLERLSDQQRDDDRRRVAAHGLLSREAPTNRPCGRSSSTSVSKPKLMTVLNVDDT